MTEQTFVSYMRQAESIRDDYCAGYQRGLRRHYHGEKFGTTAEHEKWMSLGLDGDQRTDQGRGYRDGFAGYAPRSPAGPDDIRQARKAAGLTQTQAATLVGVTLRAWQYWEAGQREMPASAWELFQIKAKELVK